MSEFLHIVCCNSCMLLITLYLRLFSCWAYLFLGSFYIQILNELCLPEYWQLIFHLFWIHLQRPCSSSSFFSCFCLIFLSFHLNWGKVYYTFQMLFFCYCSTLSAFQCCWVAKWNCFFFLCNHLNQRSNHDFTFSFSWSSFISGSRGVSSYRHFTTC